jgi:hypothetical protein
MIASDVSWHSRALRLPALQRITLKIVQKTNAVRVISDLVDEYMSVITTRKFWP